MGGRKQSGETACKGTDLLCEGTRKGSRLHPIIEHGKLCWEKIRCDHWPGLSLLAGSKFKKKKKN